MEDAAMRIDTSSQAMIFGVQPVMRTAETEKAATPAEFKGLKAPFMCSCRT